MKKFDVSSAVSHVLILFGLMVAVAPMVFGDKLDVFLSTVTLKGMIIVGDLPRYLQTLIG